MTGSNLVCTAIHRVLTRLFGKSYAMNGHMMRIKHLHVQVDNCVGENKNNFVLGFLAMLVSMEIVENVEIHFMMVGHTHIKIDQFFSR